MNDTFDIGSFEALNELMDLVNGEHGEVAGLCCAEHRGWVWSAGRGYRKVTSCE